MEKVITILCLMVIGSVVAHPANSILDKVTINDVAANSVSPDQKGQPVVPNDKKESSIQILGTSVGEPDLKYPPPNQPSVFARLIDDIFQIPISVLHSVARLLSNPFSNNKTPTDNTAAKISST